MQVNQESRRIGSGAGELEAESHGARDRIRRMSPLPPPSDRPSGAGSAPDHRPASLPSGSVSWLEIDTNAIAANVAALTGCLGPGGRLLAVVKANAYGHGVEIVAPAALRAGAGWLGVISLKEGLEVRALCGDRVPVLVMGHVPPGDVEPAVVAGLSLTVYDRQSAENAIRAARRTGVAARLHLKAETGTNRQGVECEELLPLARTIAGSGAAHFEGISTHFADIEDTTDHGFALHQMSIFRHTIEALAAEGLRPELIHAACSAAILLFPDTHFDLARAGISLYGLWPSRETLVSARSSPIEAPDLRPVMTWKCSIAQVKPLKPGAYVGYGRTWRATRPSRVAVLPVGYYEGYDRSLSGCGHVLVRGMRAPVVGRVCMNMTMVDVTDVPGVTAGDTAVLLGASGQERIRAEDLAGWAGTIHYEIVSRVHPALPRVPSP